MTISVICLVLGVVLLGAALRRDLAANPNTRLPWWGAPDGRAPYNRVIEGSGVVVSAAGLAYFDVHGSSIAAQIITTLVTLVLLTILGNRFRHNRAVAHHRLTQI